MDASSSASWLRQWAPARFLRACTRGSSTPRTNKSAMASTAADSNAIHCSRTLPRQRNGWFRCPARGCFPSDQEPRGPDGVLCGASCACSTTSQHCWRYRGAGQYPTRPKTLNQSWAAAADGSGVKPEETAGLVLSGYVPQGCHDGCGSRRQVGRAWYRVLEFVEEFGIIASLEPFALGERRGFLRRSVFSPLPSTMAWPWRFRCSASPVDTGSYDAHQPKQQQTVQRPTAHSGGHHSCDGGGNCYHAGETQR